METVDSLQEAARQRLKNAQRDLAEAENEMRDAVRAGVSARLTKTEISRISGISRPTIISWTKTT